MTAASTFAGPGGFPLPGIRPPRLGRTGPNAVARHLAERVRIATTGQDNIIVWRTRDNRLRRAEIGPRCWGLGMERSYPIRLEYRWPKRHAYSNERWLSHTGESLHCESMNERLALMQIEYFFNGPGMPRIAAAAAQPMLMLSEGRDRYPDFLLALSDGRRLVIDAKPRDKMTDEVVANLAVTRQVCETVGWEYAVVHEPRVKVTEYNLETLSSRRQQRYAPWPELREAVRDQCALPRPLGDVVDAISPIARGLVISYVHHMMWHREIDPLTLQEPLNWESLVVATPREER